LGDNVRDENVRKDLYYLLAVGVVGPRGATGSDPVQIVQPTSGDKVPQRIESEIALVRLSQREITPAPVPTLILEMPDTQCHGVVPIPSVIARSEHRVRRTQLRAIDIIVRRSAPVDLDYVPGGRPPDLDGVHQMRGVDLDDVRCGWLVVSHVGPLSTRVKPARARPETTARPAA